MLPTRTSQAAQLCGDWPAPTPLAAKADRLFDTGRWQAALTAYQQLPAAGGAELACRIGWCYLHLGDVDAARQVAGQAGEPADWHLPYLVAHLARAAKKTEASLAMLARLAARFPDNPLIRRDLAYGVYTEFADIPRGRALWQKLLTQPGMAPQVARDQLFSQFYEPLPGDPDNHATIRNYVARFFTPPQPAIHTPTHNAATRRRRIGLMSVFFHHSPVYFLTIGGLRAWANQVDLVFIDRGKMAPDAATADYRAIAAEWHAAAGIDAQTLACRLRQLDLDALIDMSGWSDIDGLRALAQKPVPRLYKWVGGQASTTGLAAFDGFIGDEHQSPHDLQPLYAEPLINLPGGYTTYEQPSYLPPGQAARQGNPVVGIISNPIKLSAAFMQSLAIAARQLERDQTPLSLRFIGSRYRHPQVQQRIRTQLQPAAESMLQLEFLSPAGHPNYLRAVAELDWVIDSWPYTGGVTILEALALGVPCRTRQGRLFCQRHGYAHARYAGLGSADFDLDRLGPFARPARSKTGASLLPADSPRRDHQRLARALDAVTAGKLPS